MIHCQKLKYFVFIQDCYKHFSGAFSFVLLAKFKNHSNFEDVFRSMEELFISLLWTDFAGLLKICSD